MSGVLKDIYFKCLANRSFTVLCSCEEIVIQQNFRLHRSKHDKFFRRTLSFLDCTFTKKGNKYVTSVYHRPTLSRLSISFFPFGASRFKINAMIIFDSWSNFFKAMVSPWNSMTSEIVNSCLSVLSQQSLNLLVYNIHFTACGQTKFRQVCPKKRRQSS